MQILLVGQGAREHALAWKLSTSPLLTQLYFWPGNAAMRHSGLGKPLPLAADASLAELALAAKRQGIELVICGPEGPLASGIKEIFAGYDLKVFGPGRKAAQLEASKAYAKAFMQRAGIPTAAFAIASKQAHLQTLAYERLQHEGQVVVKADGLAAGKGVFVCQSIAELDAALASLPLLGQAAEQVVVESCLVGRECSYFALIGHGQVTSLGFAVDFKRAEEGDQGPNTGGMGSYTPVLWLPEDAEARVQQEVLTPFLRQLAIDELSYEGFLYVGLMWTLKGPEVIEFNVRLGDPEAQVLAVNDPRDWLALILPHCGLSSFSTRVQKPSRPEEKTVAIVMASQEYPSPARPPSPESLPLPETAFYPQQDRHLFASGVREEKGGLLPSSGRILTVVSKAESFAKARSKALDECEQIGNYWKGLKWRRDIAQAVENDRPVS